MLVITALLTVLICLSYGQEVSEKEEIWKEMKYFVKAGRSMESERGGYDCIPGMKANHKQIDEIKKRIESLDTIPLDWKWIVMLLKDCNNCTNTAINWCAKADSMLNVRKPK